MAGILHELTIAAPAEKVLRTQTGKEGLSGWWTPGVTAHKNARPAVAERRVSHLCGAGCRFAAGARLAPHASRIALIAAMCRDACSACIAMISAFTLMVLFKRSLCSGQITHRPTRLEDRSGASQIVTSGFYIPQALLQYAATQQRTP